MDIIKEISTRTISISDFNKGLAGRIFEDVKASGTKVVLKNNNPECVLISPEEYSKMLEEKEDLIDQLMANERLKDLDTRKVISQGQFEEKYNINFEDIEDIDESEFEWTLN